MSICTFFGHRLCPATLEAELRSVLRDLIEYHGVDTFYIGNQGAFDGMALAVLRELAHLYPQITYTVVLAYVRLILPATGRLLCCSTGERSHHAPYLLPLPK